ncbi:MAG: type II toxin-antitoxin system RelE/ParE family toxin [candidate division NC10 bacterium]|nr:type II toxin-antitoxin system RelE/ParE family toxin [candidate division NC10 bacterium]MDE2322857.1 type II toxin-antitoxin system RelE/ParE family toxin [candidate division NC10 bacterium]
MNRQSKGSWNRTPGECCDLGAGGQPLFHRRKKKASRSLQEAIDAAVRMILTDPLIGTPKVGALKGVRVFKLIHEGLEYLVAYRSAVRERQIRFLAVGPHENFYRDLQRRATVR